MDSHFLTVHLILRSVSICSAIWPHCLCYSRLSTQHLASRQLHLNKETPFPWACTATGWINQVTFRMSRPPLGFLKMWSCKMNQLRWVQHKYGFSLISDRRTWASQEASKATVWSGLWSRQQMVLPWFKKWNGLSRVERLCNVALKLSIRCTKLHPRVTLGVVIKNTSVVVAVDGLCNSMSHLMVSLLLF